MKKILIIGGNRFMGLRLTRMVDQTDGVELHVLNRTGQVAHCRNAVVHKGDRRLLGSTFLDRDWDAVVDFACFNQTDAREAVSFFGQVGTYIFVSTVSVYNQGANLRESDFDPLKFDMSSEPSNDYQDGKRRAEVEFAREAKFPVLSVRLPIVAGPDDYTHRLDFHVDRVRKGLPIYVINPATRLSLINSEDAAKFFYWALDKKLSGPINVASRDPISLAALLAQIELIVGRAPVLAKQPSAETHSPFSTDDDWFVNVDRMLGAGFQTRSISEWLPGLIGNAEVPVSRIVH